MKKPRKNNVEYAVSLLVEPRVELEKARGYEADVAASEQALPDSQAGDGTAPPDSQVGDGRTRHKPLLIARLVMAQPLLIARLVMAALGTSPS